MREGSQITVAPRVWIGATFVIQPVGGLGDVMIATAWTAVRTRRIRFYP